MYNTQTNYPNYMPVPSTISPQLFFINTAQDLNLLPAPTGINFYYCQQENKIYSRLNQNGQIKIEEYVLKQNQNVTPPNPDLSQFENRLNKIEQFLLSKNNSQGGEPNWQL